MDSNIFYDTLSDDYDTMIAFEKRIEKEKPFFKKIIEEFDLTDALDFGCGSGLHSIILSDINIKVTGLDSSKKMIENATSNALKRNLDIEFINQNLDDFYHARKPLYDSIFCMGNTLPHFPDVDKLGQAFQKFYNMLSLGGIFVIQVLNYDEILKKKERIISIKEIGDKIFVRFYDYHKHTLTFNIMIIKRSGGKLEHSLISTEHIPLSYITLKYLADACKFSISDVYGSMNFEKYDADKSGNLIMIMMK
jgi:glycine/sarcosine N-methyltransferase